MAFAGLRGTGSYATDERPKNFREYILWANPNGRAPLTALMSKMGSASVDDPEFAWFEETLQINRIQTNVTTAYATTDNTITIVSGGLGLVPNDVLLVEKSESAAYDNELVMVSSVTSDTVIVIKRGIAGSTAVPIPVSTSLTKISTAFAEGSTSPSVSLRNTTKKYNYTQISKTALEITRTAKKTKTRVGDSWANDKKRKSFDHSVALELMFLFGRRYEDTSGTQAVRYTGGLRQFISTNNKIWSTTPTEDDFLDFIYKVFDYDSAGAGDQRIVLCGNGFLNSLNKLARKSTSTRINFTGKLDGVYGMNLQRWILPQGELGIKSHPLLNVHAKYNYSAFVINPAALKYRYITDTTFQDEIQVRDGDTQKAQWLSECGLEVHHEETMAYTGNFIV